MTNIVGQLFKSLDPWPGCGDCTNISIGITLAAWLWMNSPFIAGIVTPQLCTPLIRRKSFGLIVAAPELRFESSLTYLRQSKKLE